MKFNEVLEKMKELHEKKDRDYSGGKEFGNFYESEKIGIPAWKGAFIRLQDKYSRACNLIKGQIPAVRNEKLEDTLFDLAVYSVIVYALYKKEVVESSGGKQLRLEFVERQ